MPKIQVKKVVAMCFAEAAKLTLDHLGAHRLEVSQQAMAGGNDLTRLYGDVRRLRDLLQRSVNAFVDAIDLDLSPLDAQLLVACCRRAVEAIDVGVRSQRAGGDKQLLQRKRVVLAEWAIELAAKPLLELPLERLSKDTSDAMRAFTQKLQAKAYGDVRQSIVATTVATPVTAPAATPVRKVAANGKLPKVEPEPEPEPTPAPPSAAKASRPEGTMAADGSITLRADGDQPPTLPAPAPAPVPSPAAAGTSLFDHRQLRDPRLRSLAGVDLVSYERSLAAGDLRLATVILASIVEAALLDHAIPRRAEFGLTGAPDSWLPQELLLTVLGERSTPKDHALAFNLFASRNLLRPAAQMLNPAVVTAASFERSRDLAQRVLHTMGFALAAPVAGTNDLLAGLTGTKPAGAA